MALMHLKKKIIYQLRVFLCLLFALQVLLLPKQHYIIYILQAQDSLIQMQHTYKLVNIHLVPLEMRPLTSFFSFFFQKNSKL